MSEKKVFEIKVDYGPGENPEKWRSQDEILTEDCNFDYMSALLLTGHTALVENYTGKVTVELLRYQELVEGCDGCTVERVDFLLKRLEEWGYRPITDVELAVLANQARPEEEYSILALGNVELGPVVGPGSDINNPLVTFTCTDWYNRSFLACEILWQFESQMTEDYEIVESEPLWVGAVKVNPSTSG